MINNDKKYYSICCGSRDNDSYINIMEDTAKKIDEKGFSIKYGGSNVGIMGKLYSYCKKSNIDIVGVIPDIFKDLVDKEMAKDMIFINGDYPENFKIRQTDILFNCEVVVYLPGGAGTIYELFERIVFNQIAHYANDKKIDIVLISKTFWQPLLDLLEHIEKEKFTDKNSIKGYNIHCYDDIEEYFNSVKVS